MPNSRQFVSSCATCVAAILSTIGSDFGAWSECCDRPSRASDPAGAPSGRAREDPRTPAATSLHAPGADRCRAAPARPVLGDDMRVPELLNDGAWFATLTNTFLLDRGDTLRRRPVRSWSRACPAGLRSAVTCRYREPFPSRAFTAAASSFSPKLYSSIAADRTDRAQRIRFVLSRDVRRRAVHRLVQVRPTRPTASYRRWTPRAACRWTRPAPRLHRSEYRQTCSPSRSTSKRRGFSTSCIAQLSTSI